MQTATLNGEFSLEYPDGFHVMGVDELKQAYGTEYADMWGIRDEERHIIISFVWKESSELGLKLVSAKAIAKQYEKALSQIFKNDGYRCDGFFDTKIVGKKASGFKYAYQHEGIDQVAETVVFRSRTCNYTLYYYTRPELEEANRAVHDNVVESFSFS